MHFVISMPEGACAGRTDGKARVPKPDAGCTDRSELGACNKRHATVAIEIAGRYP
jgi:hypothetical protein